MASAKLNKIELRAKVVLFAHYTIIDGEFAGEEDAGMKNPAKSEVLVSLAITSRRFASLICLISIAQ